MEDEDSIKKKQLEKEMEKKDQHTNITGCVILLLVVIVIGVIIRTPSIL